MAFLTADVHRMHSVHQPQFLPLPLRGGARIFLNAVVCTDPDGFAVPAEDTDGFRTQGVAWKSFDNTTGADGTLGDTFNGFGAARFVEVDGQGEWEFTFTGAVPKPGDDAFVVDDDTVSTVTSESILLGKFTRPGSPGKWFVDIDRR
jgi:hypothetical protein